MSSSWNRKIRSGIRNPYDWTDHYRWMGHGRGNRVTDSSTSRKDSVYRDEKGFNNRDSLNEVKLLMLTLPRRAMDQRLLNRDLLQYRSGSQSRIGATAYSTLQSMI